MSGNQNPPADNPFKPDKAELERRAYIEHLIKTGQAAEAQDGKLPPGATHEIVGKDANGVPILKRRRFS
ncbi:MAG TPA: hypothetical protein VHD90_02325 [Phototrophicaceae bacterium]|nr:hypothetical protein [Phototrophicaceae bacterium]